MATLRRRVTAFAIVDGGPFEFVWAQLLQFRDGRPSAIELFEIEDLEVARARFDALG